MSNLIPPMSSVDRLRLTVNRKSKSPLRVLTAKNVDGRIWLSYPELCDVMRTRHIVQFWDGTHTLRVGMINGIGPEDGSGRSWIVTICKRDNTYEKVWVRAE